MTVTTAHQINGFNKRIVIECNEAGNRYKVGLDGELQCHIRFQYGPVAGGANGITDEALLAIVLHRVERFEQGPFACNENKMVIEKLRAALRWLQDRAERREAKGIEGTHQVDAEAEGQKSAEAVPGTAVPPSLIHSDISIPVLGAEPTPEEREADRSLAHQIAASVGRSTEEKLGAAFVGTDDETPVDPPTKSAAKELAEYLSTRPKTKKGKE